MLDLKSCRHCKASGEKSRVLNKTLRVLGCGLCNVPQYVFVDATLYSALDSFSTVARGPRYNYVDGKA